MEPDSSHHLNQHSSSEVVSQVPGEVPHLEEMKIQQNQKDQKEVQRKLKRYFNIIRQRLEKGPYTEEQIREYSTIFYKIIFDRQLDRALGSIYGAMIGDSLGSYCEFHHHLDDETVKKAMTMPGDGTFGLQPGQLTDDSEMASALLLGLLEYDENKQFDEIQRKKVICQIGLQYVKWVNSSPFDIGMTTRGGIQEIKGRQELIQKFLKGKTSPDFLENMFDAIYKRNQGSLANGSLMRITPMACFIALSGKDPRDTAIAEFIKDQIRLTHSSTELGIVGLCWVSILVAIINRPDNKPETFHNIFANHVEDKRFTSIASWFEQAMHPKDKSMPAVPSMGYAKIGFSYGLKVLYLLGKGQETLGEKLYEDWIYWIIKRAGDTDTNAAIAGGLFGALLGVTRLPQTYISRSLKTLTSKNRIKQIKIEDQGQELQVIRNFPQRPQIYEPCNVFLRGMDLAAKLRPELKGKNGAHL